MTAALPLRRGATGPAVRDLTARLRAAGHEPGSDVASFGPDTEAALREFQRTRGLEPDGVCDQETWSLLVEAGYSLGDRLLYLTAPMLRGDDVADLQLQLGALGFDAGRVDGIFGPRTRAALLDFQQNADIVTDEVCGPETIAALRRLRPRAGTTSVAGVRERHELRAARRQALTLRAALVHLGEAEALVGATATEIRRAGGVVAAFSGGRWSEVAAAVNEFAPQVCLALSLEASAVAEVSYFETAGFSSSGGSSLAELVVGELPTTPLWTRGSVVGARHAILRETRPPTVWLRIGPADAVAQQRAMIAAALTRSLTRWVSEPC